MIETIKIDLKNKLSSLLNFNIVVEEPKRNDYDLSIPLFQIQKHLNKPMMEIYEEVKKEVLKNKLVKETIFLNGFLNMNLYKDELSKNVLLNIFNLKNNYGNKDKNDKVVVIDYSSPNIAKNFSVGHLRSTVIGNSLKLIYQKEGYKVIGINHLGDWGTQFGKMIVAYEKWGDKKLVDENPIDELQKLYIKFHEEVEKDGSLEQQARDVFKKMEENDPYYISLWQHFREVSIKEFMRIYDVLNVSFDSYHGEAFYNDKMDSVVLELEDKNLLVEDEGAQIVRLDNLSPALIKRSDGATLYITRDLAALFYRRNTYHFDKALYVVGNEQRLHFNQLKEITKLMGYNFDVEHVNFGLILQDGKKMASRGGINKLSNVIDKAISLAKEQILDKNPTIKNIDHVAKAIGVGAIVFNDLKNERHLDIDFNLDQMLKFEGQTGPYIQYSIVRIKSILKNELLNINNVDYSVYNEQHYFDVVKLLAQFPVIIQRAQVENQPSIISKYVILLAQTFNSFYGRQKIVVEDEKIMQANLLLISSVEEVLKEGLRLLNIEVLDEM